MIVGRHRPGDTIEVSTWVSCASVELDLDAIETDLADVEVALARLESGQYWTCEITGEALDDELLAANPTARRLPGRP